MSRSRAGGSSPSPRCSRSPRRRSPAGTPTSSAPCPRRAPPCRTAPARVSFAYDEPIEVSFGTIRVYDGAGREVQSGEPFRPEGTRDALAIALRPDLPDGAYRAVYRIISVDAHPTVGGVVFSIGAGGTAAAPPLPAEEATGRAALGGVLGRPLARLRRDRARRRRALLPALGLAPDARRGRPVPASVGSTRQPRSTAASVCCSRSQSRPASRRACSRCRSRPPPPAASRSGMRSAATRSTRCSTRASGRSCSCAPRRGPSSASSSGSPPAAIACRR